MVPCHPDGSPGLCPRLVAGNLERLIRAAEKPGMVLSEVRAALGWASGQ